MKLTSTVLERIIKTNMVTEKDIEWFQRVQEYPDIYELLFEYGDLHVGTKGNSEDFDYDFSIGGSELIEFLLIVIGVEFNYV